MSAVVNDSGGPDTVAFVRESYLAEVVPGIPQYGKFDRVLVGLLLDEIDRLLAEIDRLKRGDFTEEEFQGLCHNTAVQEGVGRFRAGCDAYIAKLFPCAT